MENASTKPVTNRVALITGSSRGIGAAIARRLAADGLSVAITYGRSKDAAARVAAACEEQGVQVAAFDFDAASKQAAQDIVPRVVERFGRLDVLVCNAGIVRVASLADVTDEDYEECMRVNVDHVFYSARAAARVLPRGGRILVIGSLAATRAPWPGATVYSATKGAVAAFSRAAARDLGPRGITVNCIQPGAIDTDMNPADGPYAALSKQMAALGEYGTPADVAELASFLASSRASRITGAVLNVDGGDV